MTCGELQATISGRVLVPGDHDYDRSRSVWNAMVDRRPRFIVQCASSADVAASVRFAREHDLEIGIHCGGHGIVGHAVPDGGLMIDLRPMGGVSVDPTTRRARVQGGALLGALDRAAQRTVLRRRPGMSRTRASAGSPSAAGWAGWPGSTG
jgi:FAD/FMN-containing dehydrogenase